eukprot:scaffold2393_cov267-Pinguiococcus_pyrenoidosus.AAC.6
MRNGNDCSALRRFPQALQDVRLGEGVHRRSDLVAEEHVRLLEDRARDRDSLALPAAERRAPLPHPRGIPLRLPQNRIVQASLLCRLLHGRLIAVAHAGYSPSRPIRKAVRDVGSHRVVKEAVVLRHHADRGPQQLQRDLVEALAVDLHGALDGVVQPRHELQQRRLPGAARSHDRHPLPRRDRHGDVLQRGTGVVWVAERHLVELDEASQGPRYRGRAFREVIQRLGKRPARTSRGVGDGRSRVQNTKRILQVHESLSKLLVGVPDEIERHCELQEQGVHRHQVADRHPAALHPLDAHHHARRQTDGEDQRLPDVQAGHAEGVEHVHAFDPSQKLVLVARGLGLLSPEQLHCLVVHQAIHKVGVACTVHLDQLSSDSHPPLGELCSVRGVDGKHCKRHEREGAAGSSRHDGAAQGQLHQRGHHREDQLEQDALEAAGAADVRHRQRARRVRQMKACVQRVQVPEQRRRKAPHRRLTHPRKESRLGLLEKGRHTASCAVEQHERGRAGRRHHSEEALLRPGRQRAGVQRVDRRLQHQRHGHRDPLARQEAAERRHHQQLLLDVVLRPHKAHHVPHDFSLAESLLLHRFLLRSGAVHSRSWHIRVSRADAHAEQTRGATPGRAIRRCRQRKGRQQQQHQRA